MATVANPFGSDQDENTPNSTSGGGATSSAPSNGTSSVGGNSASKPSSSGSFSNINKYINANKDVNSDQGGMAGQVANNIGQQAQQQNQNIQGAQNTFNTQAQQNFSGFNNLDAVKQASADPYGFMQNNPQGTQQVQAAENANYTGPSGFESLSGNQNLNNLQTQNSNLQNLAKQTQSQSGQYNLLRQMFGTPTYTRGQQGLDQAIMNNTPGAQDQFAQARQNASQVGAGLNAAQQQAQKQAQDYTSQAQQIGEQSKGLLNNAVGGLNTDLTGRLNQYVTQQGTNLTNAQKDLTSGQLTAQDYANLGGTNSGLTGGQYLYGLTPDDISKYVTKTSAAPTTQQIASQQDYQKIQALNQLLGNNASTNNSAFLSSFNDPSKAGTAGSGVTFDQGGFQSALANAKAGYDKRVDDMNALYAGQLNSVNGQIADLQNSNPNISDPHNVAYNPDDFEAQKQASLNNLNNTRNSILANQPIALNSLKKYMGNQLSIGQPATASVAPGVLGNGNEAQ